MASKIGAPFVQASFEPLRAAAKKLAEGHLSEGLDALSRQRLEAGYQKGIEATMRNLRVPRGLVEQALPTADVQGVLDHVDQSQRTARRSVGQFVGSLGSLVPGGGGLDDSTSRRLQAVADKYTLDEHISNPVGALSESVARWEELLDQAHQRLSNDAALRAIVLRRRVLWAVIGVVFFVVLGCSAGAGMWHHVVVTGAQQRVAAFTSQTDPCVGEQVDEADLEHALPEQIQRLEQMKGACAEQREREAHLTRCAALAERVAAGKLAAEDRAEAGSAYELLARVAARELTPKDLTVGGDAMPCADTPSQSALWTAYTSSATASVELWGKVETISPHVASLLKSKGVGLCDRARETLLFRVEAETKRAITKGLDSELARARRLCGLVDQLGYPKEPWCKALDRIDARR